MRVSTGPRVLPEDNAATMCRPLYFADINRTPPTLLDLLEKKLDNVSVCCKNIAISS
jgi:hypothetical protein